MKTYANLSRAERIEKVMQTRRADLALVLENLAEDLNISAILRTAESFGVGKICVIHAEGKLPKISKNTSSGASKWLDVKNFTSLKKCINELKKDRFKIIAALVDPDAKVLWEQKFNGKIAILVGNEALGMSEEAKKLVDENIYLPMFGLTESLNVSVAAAIFLYEVIRQKEKVTSNN
ncbi:RNA methyltransferase [Candidatus Daviesbacteria bacterium]|nr:RNA methyltransferase [Candidatus Daviesbacteria bacterium]